MTDDIELIMNIAVLNGHTPELRSMIQLNAQYVLCWNCIEWLWTEPSVHRYWKPGGYMYPCGAIPGHCLP